jgi:hypothetical protein
VQIAETLAELDFMWALLVPRGMALSQSDAVAKEWMGRPVAR